VGDWQKPPRQKRRHLSQIGHRLEILSLIAISKSGYTQCLRDPLLVQCLPRTYSTPNWTWYSKCSSPHRQTYSSRMRMTVEVISKFCLHPLRHERLCGSAAWRGC